MRIKRFEASFLLALFVFISIVESALHAYAEGIPADTDFSGLYWEKAFEVTPMQNGVIQSLIATDNYIITIENVADDSSLPDIVTSYYRYGEDKDGNPVTQYSIANQNGEEHWEHGNGMAYNPDTGQVYVALYTSLAGDDGCIYVLDPETLHYTDVIQVSTMYNILGIGYDRMANDYVIQANADGEYAFKTLDLNWELKEDLGPADISPGTNSQDLCVIGDYIINSPMEPSFQTPYLNIYSMSRNEKVATIDMGIDLEGASRCEPESVTELEPGRIMVVVNLYYADGSRKAVFYTCDLPYGFSITTNVSNGTITDSNAVVERGSTYEVTYAPNEDYVLDEILVDGQLVDPKAFKDGYSFENIQDDHTVEVHYLTKEEKKAKDKGDSGTQTGVAKPEKKKGKAGKVVLIIFLVFVGLAVLFFAWYLYMLRLKRERARRRRAAQARRRAMLERERKESMEGWDD